MRAKVILLAPATAWWIAGILLAGPAVAQAQGSRPAPAVYYYPAPGYYATTRGQVLIPRPGYYYNVPVSAARAPRPGSQTTPSVTSYSRGYSSAPALSNPNAGSVTRAVEGAGTTAFPSVRPTLYFDPRTQRYYYSGGYALGSANASYYPSAVPGSDRRNAAGIGAEGTEGRTSPAEWGNP